MKTITQALLALGFVGAMAIGSQVPASAQGVYFSSPGVSVEVGTRSDRYRYNRRYYRNYDNSYAYGRQPYSYRYYNNQNGYSGYGYSGYSGNNGYNDRHSIQ
jgi:hypothetical protein